VKRLLIAVACAVMLPWLVAAPAEAKPKPPPSPSSSCTFAKGMTTCTETETTTSPGPQDGQACLTSDNRPGVIEQEQTSTTTTTRTYKGRNTSGTPDSQSTRTTTAPGPATCVADPTVPTGPLLITPYPTGCPDGSACYDLTGAGLEPGSSVTVHYTFTSRTTGEVFPVADTASSPVRGDGTASYGWTFQCDPTGYSYTDFYATGTDAGGNPVTSNEVDPCP
jgi:hypothetical protein